MATIKYGTISRPVASDGGSTTLANMPYQIPVEVAGDKFVSTSGKLSNGLPYTLTPTGDGKGVISFNGNESFFDNLRLSKDFFDISLPSTAFASGKAPAGVNAKVNWNVSSSNQLYSSNAKPVSPYLITYRNDNTNKIGKIPADSLLAQQIIAGKKPGYKVIDNDTPVAPPNQATVTVTGNKTPVSNQSLAGLSVVGNADASPPTTVSQTTPTKSGSKSPTVTPPTVTPNTGSLAPTNNGQPITNLMLNSSDYKAPPVTTGGNFGGLPPVVTPPTVTPVVTPPQDGGYGKTNPQNHQNIPGGFFQINTQNLSDVAKKMGYTGDITDAYGMAIFLNGMLGSGGEKYYNDYIAGLKTNPSTQTISELTGNGGNTQPNLKTNLGAVGSPGGQEKTPGTDQTVTKPEDYKYPTEQPIITTTPVVPTTDPGINTTVVNKVTEPVNPATADTTGGNPPPPVTPPSGFTQQDFNAWGDKFNGAFTKWGDDFSKNMTSGINDWAKNLNTSIINGVDAKNQKFGVDATNGFLNAFQNFAIPTGQQNGVNLGNYNDNRNAAADQWWSSYVTGRR